MNQVVLIGRVVREMELREVSEGRVVLNNTLAVPRVFRSDQGPQADFIPFVAWGKVANLINQYCKKGHTVGLAGRIQSRSYINKEEETVYVVEMMVDEVHLIQNRTMKDSEAAIA